ncbi:hypothetical protein BX616_006202, partial [Lobosporangium transversale]
QQQQEQQQQQQQQQHQQQQNVGHQNNQLHQQPTFRANYEPSAMSGDGTSVPTSSATPQSSAPFQPMAVALTNAKTGGSQSNLHASEEAGSAGFPTPPPPPPVSQSATSVYTYFPGSGNQPPISPPPNMRNSVSQVRPPFSQGSGSFQGQGGILPSTVASPSSFAPNQSHPVSPISPQQHRYSQQPTQYQQQPTQFQQQQFQQQGQYQTPYSQQPQQPGSLSPAGTTDAIGTHSHMTTKQMAAAVKKKFGSKW